MLLMHFLIFRIILSKFQFEFAAFKLSKTSNNYRDNTTKTRYKTLTAELKVHLSQLPELF